jgi:nitronate monooxygenase
MKWVSKQRWADSADPFLNRFKQQKFKEKGKSFDRMWFYFWEVGMDGSLTSRLNIELPVIGGAMYPCSNPELVAAVSEAGGIGVIQPIALTYAHGYSFRDGLRYLRTLTQKPLGMNVIVEKSVKRYQERMEQWVAIALEEGIRFFVTALGNPRWVVEAVKAYPDGVVFHDVTERQWAEKALEAQVDGLICVNAHAGGHAGRLTPSALLADLQDLAVPLVCAGGVGDATTFEAMLRLGYQGVQMGTRLIATKECSAHADYKEAILKATPEDIVLTERLSGVPVAIIATPAVKKSGIHAGPLAKKLLRHPRTKHWMRTLFALSSIARLKKAARSGSAYGDYFQAGRSVGQVESVDDVASILKPFGERYRAFSAES